MLRVNEHETIPRRRSGEDARLSERLVRRVGRQHLSDRMS